MTGWGKIPFRLVRKSLPEEVLLELRIQCQGVSHLESKQKNIPVRGKNQFKVPKVGIAYDGHRTERRALYLEYVSKGDSHQRGRQGPDQVARALWAMKGLWVSF